MRMCQRGCTNAEVSTRMCQRGGLDSDAAPGLPDRRRKCCRHGAFGPPPGIRRGGCRSRSPARPQMAARSAGRGRRSWGTAIAAAAAAQVVHGMDHHTPQLRVAALDRQRQGLAAAIAAQQPQLPPTADQATHQEATGVGGDHHLARVGIKAAVDHEQIPINNPIATHRITADPHEEGGQGRGDQLAVEIDARLDVIRCRAGEAGRHNLPRPGAAVGGRIRPQRQRHTSGQIDEIVGHDLRQNGG